MKKLLLVCLAFCFATSDGGVHADSASFTIDDYNAALPIWGTSWLAGPDAIHGYYPTFYTGFAPRQENPDRIHIRLARGNQTRVSVALDDETIEDYLFDLVKRYRFYARATAGSRPLVNVNPDPSRTQRSIPQLEFFRKIVESPTYGILSFVERAENGDRSEEEIYTRALETMKRLNPGRVFFPRIDLERAFLSWRGKVREILKGGDPEIVFKPKSVSTVSALQSLLPGRVDVTMEPSVGLLERLVSVSRLASDPSVSDADFVMATKDLFEAVTLGRYEFRVYRDGGWKPAIDCQRANRCFLSYPEFTAVYPTGSLMESTVDSNGNSIPRYATPGLWRFVSRGSRQVDNIRQEPYYGWAPKMDYEAAGNGFHNPAVRFTSISRAVRDQLNIPEAHRTFWSVKRGGVSHGCSRLPLGHIWEMRHIFPVEDEKMVRVHHFGSDSRDFDLYDVDGDGREEVIGVEYLISYGLREAGGLGSREGTDLEIGKEQKKAFYEKLYGANGVFRQTSDGGFVFSSPTVSYPSFLDLKKKRVSVRTRAEGEFALYEQEYERDKVQYYLPVTIVGLTAPGAEPLSKRIVRLMGRIRGCAPSSDRERCGEAAFDREAEKIFREAGATLAGDLQ